MKLPKIAIDNYQFTLVIFLLLVLLGLDSFLTMPRTEDPPLQLPGASIITIYPGTNPMDMEELVVTPIEEALNELDDIKKIEATIQYGLAHIAIEFTFGTDPDDKFEEVVRQVNSIRNDLPSDMYDLEIMQYRSSDVCIMQLALVSDDKPFDLLEKEAEKLKKAMEKVNGVLRINILAVPAKEVRIALDMEKMAKMNISLNEVAQAIQSTNANIPGGSLILSGIDYNVKTSGTYADLEEIKNTIVKSEQGRISYLRDIARVDFNFEDNRYYARQNGQRAIFISVQQKMNFNIYTIAEEIDRIIESYELNKADPSIHLEYIFDQTESVDSRINGFLSNLIGGIILVGILIFLSLGFRAAVLVMLAIPFSILIGLGFVDLTGFGLQQITIAALVIALGLLVDNSIVIVENIERFIELGKTRKEAAIIGTSRLGWPIVSATMTTVLAFIPLIAMPDKAGKFIQSMPITVIFTLIISLFLALTLTPYVSMIFLKEHRNSTDSKSATFKVKKGLKALIEGPYRKILNYSLKRAWLVITASLLAMGGATLLFTQVGVSFFPKAEKPQFMIRIYTPEGSSIDHTDTIVRKVETVLDTIPLIKSYASNIGHGNPRIYYNIFPKRYQKNFAEIFVELSDYEAETFDQLISHIRRHFSDFPGARIEVKEFEQGAPVEAPLAIKITGNNLDILQRIALDVENHVWETSGVVNIDNPISRGRTDIFVHINKDKASLLGVPIVEIDRTLRTAIAGVKISEYRDQEGNDYDMVLRLSTSNQIQLRDFDRIYVSSLSGKTIPVRQLAHITFRKSPGMITHYNLDRSATVTGDIQKGYSLDKIATQIDNRLQNYPWPEGYEYKFTGEIESRKESFAGMQRASVIAIIAIFAVLVLQFRSVRQPLIIFSAIPLAVVGSVIALYLTGNTFSFTAFIGLISLIGIVVNNSIILVDYSNELIRDGLSILEAVKEASEVRFTPILLTTFTTIGGLLPLTLRGGTLWAPMGWTIIGGLLFSTLLTLLLVPVLYYILTGNKD